MIDKRIKVAKRLKDYKDILEDLEKEADNNTYYGMIHIPYEEGKAAAYRIALSFFEEYLEEFTYKKEKED